MRLYPPDLFEPVWTKLAALVDSEVLRAPVDVLLELERQSDDLHKWAIGIHSMFVDVDDAQAVKVKEIVNQFPNLVKPNSTKSAADPFVIALAELAGTAVVTYERKAKATDAPKIPNVCEARRIKVITLVELLRAEGFKL